MITPASLYRDAVRLREAKEHTAALKALAVLSTLGRSPLIAHETGLNLFLSRQPAAALPYFYDSATTIPEGWYLIGCCLQGLGRHGEAAEVLRKRAPQTQVTQNLIAISHYAAGRWADALDILSRSPHPRAADTDQNLGHLYLGFGRWDIGWPLYARRHAALNPAITPDRVECLDEIRDQRVLVCAEQGFGDCLQFQRWIKPLTEIASKVVLWTRPPLWRLLDNQKICRVITDVSERDALLRGGWRRIPVMDLGGLFDARPDSIPYTAGYLTVPQSAIDRMCLPPSSKLRIGLCWQGSMRPAIPFTDLAPLLALEDAEFVSLQMPDRQHPDHANLRRVLAVDSDYLDTAALIMQLDLVVTVDTSVAHLAGALGKPVWLLNAFNSCWRWGWEEDFCWYDGMTQIRQTADVGWSEVVARVVADLKVRAKSETRLAPVMG